MKISLSKRLAAVAAFVPDGSPMADIGTDHALLPVHLVGTGKCPRAIAGDVRAGPVRAAEAQVRRAGLEDRIEVRMGDGFSILRPGEADTAVIAGMGGGTIREILSAADLDALGVRRLVLQPNVDERSVREWLLENEWMLLDEALVEEDGLTYEILAAERGSRGAAEAHNERLYSAPLPAACDPSREIRLLMGPILLTKPTEPFLAKWRAHAERLERRIREMERSAHPETSRKREQFRREKKEIEEVLACLSK